MNAGIEPDEYDAELDRLASEVYERDGDPADVVWDVVAEVVPDLTTPLCDRLVDLSEHEPDEALVEQVAVHRDSDEDERRRAQAVTVLVADVQARVAEAEQ